MAEYPAGGAAAGLADPTTTKGDLIVHGSSTTRLAVGADAQVLTADSSVAAGVKWAAAAGATPAYARSVSNITTNVDTTSTSFVEIDTSMRVTITVPASGVARVEVSLNIVLGSGTVADAFLGVDPGTGTYTQVGAQPLQSSSQFLPWFASYVFTGLTPGSTVFKFGWKTSGGTIRVPGAGRGGTGPGCWMAVTV